MHIGILGTGGVAQALAARLASAGHTVTLGSRVPHEKQHLAQPVADLGTTVAQAQFVINATKGGAVLGIVEQLGSSAFDGKTVLDLANGLTPEFALAFPNDSLGRQLQQAIPTARVVKALNTVNTAVMTDPGPLSHTSVFVSGDDVDAKQQVVDVIHDLGWDRESVIDLGGIATARAPEHYSLLFFALAQALQTRAVNIQVVRA